MPRSFVGYAFLLVTENGWAWDDIIFLDCPRYGNHHHRGGGVRIDRKKNYYSKVFADLLYHSEFGLIRKKENRFATTCGNCQLVCWKTREERMQNYEILINSGVVEEGENFSFKVNRVGSEYSVILEEF